MDQGGRECRDWGSLPGLEQIRLSFFSSGVSLLTFLQVKTEERHALLTIMDCSKVDSGPYTITASNELGQYFAIINVQVRKDHSLGVHSDFVHDQHCLPSQSSHIMIVQDCLVVLLLYCLLQYLQILGT